VSGAEIGAVALVGGDEGRVSQGRRLRGTVIFGYSGLRGRYGELRATPATATVSLCTQDRGLDVNW
jgi:hypothetical protein